MPLIRTIQIGDQATLGIWHLDEPESFFADKVRISREVHHPHKRLQHLAARYLLQCLEPDFPLDDIRITAAKKPYLPDAAYDFSLAHCGDYAVAIVSRQGRTGVDVELVHPKVDKVAHKFLSDGELAFLDPCRRTEHLTVCWSAKEAIFKWHGLGQLDFRKHIILEPFAVGTAGLIPAVFSKDGARARLSLHYLLEGDRCVTWLLDTPGIPQGAFGKA